jgi:hypothetical protein
MENLFIDLFLVMYFLLTGFCIIFWIIGNQIRDKPRIFDMAKAAQGLFSAAQGYLVFAVLLILFLTVTGQITGLSLVGLIFSIVAIFVSLGLYCLNESRKN